MKNKANKKNQNVKKKKSNALPIIAILLFISFVVYYFLPSGNKSVVKQNPLVTNDVESIIKFTKDGELSFSKSNGEFVTTIDFELADTFEDRARGLMNRENLKENQGMFFVFPREEPQSFWMKNTLLSLDMIFVNSNREIVKIHSNTKVMSENGYPSIKPAIYVIEVIAGFTDKYNIQEGDKIVWRKI